MVTWTGRYSQACIFPNSTPLLGCWELQNFRRPKTHDQSLKNTRESRWKDIEAGEGAEVWEVFGLLPVYNGTLGKPLCPRSVPSSQPHEDDDSGLPHRSCLICKKGTYSTQLLEFLGRINDSFSWLYLPRDLAWSLFPLPDSSLPDSFSLPRAFLFSLPLTMLLNFILIFY